MSDKKPVVFVVIAIIFSFAAYNLYSYFQLEKVARQEQAILHAQQQAEAKLQKTELE